jgi:gas vesicle structural protein
LLELVDRVLAKGVVLRGDITISVADVDLIYLGVKLLLASVDKAEEFKQLSLERAIERAAEQETER